MTTFETSRTLPATIDAVFAAIADPARFARWWGPNGFTNTFQVCDFRPGGRWLFVMHGPDGVDYKNESVFAEIEPPHRVVIDHIAGPKYRLTMLLEPCGTETKLRWTQVFESESVARRLAAIVTPANEQNLDRLTAELARVASWTATDADPTASTSC